MDSFIYASNPRSPCLHLLSAGIREVFTISGSEVAFISQVRAKGLFSVKEYNIEEYKSSQNDLKGIKSSLLNLSF